jgi:thiamine biosynthesis lipoprotein
MLIRNFRAMNTDCLVILNPIEEDGVEAAANAEDVVRDYERMFSRFQARSDLGQLNASTEKSVRVSAPLADILARALGYSRLTDGVFDPLILNDLEALGYDESFERLAAAQPGEARRLSSVMTALRFDVDVAGRTVTRPVGARIDLGGIAKGAAADAAAATLASFPGGLVDLGGDIRAFGQPADAPQWIVAVQDPGSDAGVLDTLLIGDGAVATSSIVKRRWVRNGENVHHITDPRTRRPARSGVLQCSALADSAEHAEIAAKVGLILGADELREDGNIGRALRLRGIAWVNDDGTYWRSDGWSEACFR